MAGLLFPLLRDVTHSLAKKREIEGKGSKDRKEGREKNRKKKGGEKKRVRS